MVENCIFCQIVKGQIPAFKIYEDQDFLAFLDIYPFCRGHTQVIPKRHFRWVWDLPNLGGYFEVVGKIVTHYRKVLKDEFVSSVVWGMMVPHAHIQILPSPRKIELGQAWERGRLSERTGKKLVKKLALFKKF
jgi:histidine triad (HIT) family protein